MDFHAYSKEDVNKKLRCVDPEERSLSIIFTKP